MNKTNKFSRIAYCQYSNFMTVNTLFVKMNKRSKIKRFKT